MPKTLKAEGSGALIANCDGNEIVELADDLLKLLSVKGINESDINQMATEWSKFIVENYKSLTLEEIFLAHEMAVKGDLRNEKGDVVEVFQRLDNVQSGKVLRAYINFKINDHPHQSAKQNLKKLSEITHQPDLKKIDDEYLKMVLSEIESGKEFRSIQAQFLYDDFKDEIKITQEEKQSLYDKEKASYSAEINAKKKEKRNDRQMMHHIEKVKDSKKIINDRCKSILVCKHLVEKYKLKIK